MPDQRAARPRAIPPRLAGRPIKAIGTAVGRSEVWFRKWWGRYLEAGPEGLFDLTRANHHVAQRIPPELERAIVSIRRRLQAHATPARVEELHPVAQGLKLRFRADLEKNDEIEGPNPARRSPETGPVAAESVDKLLRGWPSRASLAPCCRMRRGARVAV